MLAHRSKLAVVVALRWLFYCKPWPLTHNSTSFLNYYLLTHVLGLLAYAGIWFLGLSAQYLDNVMVYLWPGILGFTILAWLVGFEPAKLKHVVF